MRTPLGPPVHEVFTPAGYAEHALVDRPVVRDLGRLLAGEHAVLVHGPSGAGKTTAVLAACRARGGPAVVTWCRRDHTLAGALVAAEPVPGTPPVRLPLPAESGRDPGTLVAALDGREATWVLEDVHKLPRQARTDLAEAMRCLAGSGGAGRLVAIGTAADLGEAEGLPDVARVAVTPLTRAEIDGALVAGARVLNVDLPAEVRATIVDHARGDAALSHLGALRVLAACGIERSAPQPARIDVARARAELRHVPRDPH